MEPVHMLQLPQARNDASKMLKVLYGHLDTLQACGELQLANDLVEIINDATTVELARLWQAYGLMTGTVH